MSAELRIEVKAEPPSGNDYKRFHVIDQWVKRDGVPTRVPIPQWYHTAEAKAWWRVIAAAAGGRAVFGKNIEVGYIVYQGFKSRGDVDNYAKTILDALVHAKVLKSDAAVTDLHGHKRRDRDNPRTVIVVRSAQDQLFGGKNDDDSF